MNRYPCEESTVDIEYGDMRIRLWIDNPNNGRLIADILAQVRRVVHDTATTNNYVLLCEEFARRVEHVNAAQVIMRTDPLIHVGHMIYTVPFSE